MSAATGSYPKPTYAGTVQGPYGLDSMGRSSLSSADEAIIDAATPSAIALTNAESGAVVIGTPVYMYAANQVKKGRANAAGTSGVIGLVKEASIAAAELATVQCDGVFTATTAEWDTICGTTGGLAAGTVYYLSAATAGKLTATAPSTSTQYVVEVGRAISSTKMLLAPKTPVVVP